MRRSLVQNLVPEATTIFVVRSYLKLRNILNFNYHVISHTRVRLMIYDASF